MSSSRALLELLRLELDDREDLVRWHQERSLDESLDDESLLRRLRTWNVAVAELTVARDLVAIVAAYFDDDPVFWTRPRVAKRRDEPIL